MDTTLRAACLTVEASRQSSLPLADLFALVYFFDDEHVCVVTVEPRQNSLNQAFWRKCCYGISFSAKDHPDHDKHRDHFQNLSESWRRGKLQG